MDCAIELEYVKSIKPVGTRVGEYFYDSKTDTIYYSINYPFPCAFSVQSLSKIRVTPMFMKLPTFLKWHNIDWLRQHLMQLKCISKRAVLMHGAAWRLGGSGYLAVGFANSGKTTTILKQLQAGAELCADENVIVTEDRMMYPVYRKSSISPWQVKEFKIPLTMKQKIDLAFSRVRALCPLFEPNIWYDLPNERKSFKLDHLQFLTPHALDKATALILLTDNEFPFITNPVIQAYAYATGFDLAGKYAIYKEVLTKIGGSDGYNTVLNTGTNATNAASLSISSNMGFWNC